MASGRAGTRTFRCMLVDTVFPLPSGRGLTLLVIKLEILRALTLLDVVMTCESLVAPSVLEA